MRIILIYPDDLGKQTEDEIIDWMKAVVNNPSYFLAGQVYSPLKYVSDMEVEYGLRTT